MNNRISAGTLRVAIAVTVFVAGLLIAGLLRFWQFKLADPPAFSAYASVLYAGITIVAAVLLVRMGVPFKRLGFGVPIAPARVLILALAGIGVLQVSGWLLGPVWESLFGAGRDLTRFNEAGNSATAILPLMIQNWTVAAFGEELTFRILLMRSVGFLLGDSRKALGIALIVQAAVFGLVHAYQGPAGIAGSFTSGLVFGLLVLAARGSIWPAALAHGGNNTIGILGLWSG